MRARYVICAVVATVVAVADQAAKLAAMAHLPGREPVEIIPGFMQLIYVLNRGAAFGFLNRADIDWQVPFFLVVTLAAAVLLIYMLRTALARIRLQAAAIGLVLGGALGNAVDRVRLGAVIDYLDVYVGDYHWPAFNLADAAITCGVGLVLIAQFTSRHASDADRNRSDNAV
jgi:signal peptidase II